MIPRISIIIPCYNHGEYIEEAIESINQCEQKDLYEVIIVNDGSTENKTIEVLKKLETSGYQILHQQNLGVGAARNNGIKAARGEFILPLDSDNKIKEQFLLKAIKIFDKDISIAVIYSDSIFFGEQNLLKKAGLFDSDKLIIGNYIDACAFFRKSAWEAVEGYDENMPYMGYEDWDFWLKLAHNQYKFHYLNEVLFEYRVSADSMMRKLEPAKRRLVFDYIIKKNFLMYYDGHKKYYDKYNYLYKDYSVNRCFRILRQIKEAIKHCVGFHKKKF